MNLRLRIQLDSFSPIFFLVHIPIILGYLKTILISTYILYK
nr:MAG TPA: hypothetical protein [Caudoviricetes sp.]